jgi:hypothetical protein
MRCNWKKWHCKKANVCPLACKFSECEYLQVFFQFLQVLTFAKEPFFLFVLWLAQEYWQFGKFGGGRLDHFLYVKYVHMCMYIKQFSFYTIPKLPNAMTWYSSKSTHSPNLILRKIIFASHIFAQVMSKSGKCCFCEVLTNK